MCRKARSHLSQMFYFSENAYIVTQLYHRYGAVTTSAFAEVFRKTEAFDISVTGALQVHFPRAHSSLRTSEEECRFQKPSSLNGFRWACFQC